MASIIDSFQESINENLAIVKIFVFSIPVYCCIQLFLMGKMEQLTFSMGVKDVGNIDPSKVNDIVTGLSVDITQTFKPSAGPVYIYTDNTPAKYTLK